MPRLRVFDQKENRFEFTNIWFGGRNKPSFREYVHPEWRGKPCVYLEIGVHEGQCLVWMFKHVLTHRDSRAVGVDPWLMTRKQDEAFMEKVRERAEQNLKPWTTR